MVYKLGVPVSSARHRITMVGLTLLFVAVSTGIATRSYALMQEHAIDPVNTNLKSAPFDNNYGTSNISHAQSPPVPSQQINSAAPPPILAAETGCGVTGKSRTGLDKAVSKQIKQLAAYDAVCDDSTINTLSFFVPMPTTMEQAQAYGKEVAVKLKEFSKYGLSPLVFLEPTTETGTLDLKQYRNGTYDAAMNAYYKTIKAAGISDASMGNWVLFPEPNIPGWNSVDPNDFAANVSKTAKLQKQYFPNSRATVMLDAQTYPSANSWQNGAYSSFAPYLAGIPDGLLDSFGLQGFPWAAPANEPADGSVYNPSVYLPTKLASEAATILGTKNIWLNTGTFGATYSNDPTKKIEISMDKRQTMMNGVLANATTLNNQGFSVSLHLFAEDKSKTSEAIDWSFIGEPDGQQMFKNVVRETSSSNISLWLFDTSN